MKRKRVGSVQSVMRLRKNDKNNATKQMHADIKELSGDGRGKAGSGCIKSKNGDLLFEKEQILDRWSEYVRDLFADDRPPLPKPSMPRPPSHRKSWAFHQIPEP